MKPKLEWLCHGTTLDVKNPGAYWICGIRKAFTPAPFNCRRIAREGFKNNKESNQFQFV